MTRLGQIIGEFVEYVTASTIGGGYAVTETRTRRFDAPPSLTVSSTNGSIAVRSEDREDVVVDGTWRGRDRSALETATLVDSGGDDEPLHLEVDHGDVASDVAVELSIAIPEDTAVDRLETANGEISLSDATGPADLSTKNGSITAERVAGPLDVRAHNGEITVRECAGLEHVETRNGAIQVELLDLREDATIRTATGRIEVALDPAIDVDLTCETNVGGIEVPVLDRSTTGVGKTTVTGTLGAGGPELLATAKVGSIEVRALEPDRVQSG